MSENGIRPSWSLSAKLQMRSSSPSRFSGDSPVHGSASTLERIGESADDKVSVSCFGSLRSLSGSYLEPSEDSGRQEHRTVGRAPLAVMEGVFRDEKPARKAGLFVDSHGQSAALQVDPFGNNNQIAFVDQSDSVESSPVKEGRRFSGAELPPEQAGTAPAKAPSSKDSCEPDRGLRKGTAILSSQDSLTSRQSAVSPPPSKPLPKASRSRSKADSCRPSGRHGSPALGQSRKEASSRSREALSAVSAQQRQKPLCATASSSSSSSRRNSAGASGRGQATAGKSRTSERSLSREGSKGSLVSDKVGATPSSRTGSPRTGQSRGEGRAPDGKHVRSSSMASLHSPPPGTRSGLKRDSRSEDKGLSFFKSALRQKESRRSADLGKTSLLSKKIAGGSTKAVGRSLPEEKPDKGHAQPLPIPAAKDGAPIKQVLLANRKSSRSSQPEAAPQSPSGSKPAGEKLLRSKLPPSMPSPARPSSRPQ